MTIRKTKVAIMQNRLKNWGLMSFVAAILLVGCKNNTPNAQHETTIGKQSVDQSTINWIGMWQNRESKKKLVNSAIREFELQHQDVNVRIKYIEEFCDKCDNPSAAVQDSIVQTILNNQFKWDIITLTARAYAGIANVLNDPEWGKKYLVDFGESDWFKERHIDQAFEVAQYRDDFGGIFAGPLIEGRYYGLWYNAETAKKLGIDIKNTGMTYRDFLGYCQRVNEYNQTASEKITFMSARKINDQIGDIFNSLVLSEVGPLNNGLPDKQVARAAIRKALKAIEALSEFNAINASINTDADFIHSLDGAVLFTVQPSSWYNQCETEDKVKALNLVPAELPVFENSPQYYRGSFQSVWAVFKNSPHSKEAVELMKYISSVDVAERWLSTTYNPTGLKVRLNASDFGQNDIEKFNSYIEKKYGSRLMNYDLGVLLFGKSMRLLPTPVLDGSMTADEFYRKNVAQY
jgi:ABC-type glycerol-3-phosphate transport system substrate-binding protein